MNHRLWSILLSVVICYHTNAGALYGEHTFAHMCEKTKQTYQIACKKTRLVYEKAKKHKKLIVGITAYLVFEYIGYSHDWDTPLRRLMTPARLLNEAQGTITNLNNVIHGHAKHIENLTNLHQQELEQQQLRHAQDLENQPQQSPEQQQQAQQELQQRCEELERQLQVLQNREQQRIQGTKELMDEFKNSPLGKPYRF